MMNDIERGRELALWIRARKRFYITLPIDDVNILTAYISHLEAKAARGERIEAAARKTVKYECWADPRFDYHEKLCRGCECEWICQALGAVESPISTANEER